MSIKLALISVSDKTGAVEFAQGLARAGVGIISSGGTAKALRDKGIACREISELTGFPEILDGRVKTLNPKVHGGILARRDKPGHLDELKKHGIEAIDLVVVNLYPFEGTLAKEATPDKRINEEIIENIDIGGVALLRAAAKNFNDVLVITNPGDYGRVLESISGNAVTAELRRELAAKAFSHTAYYDAVISSYFTLEKFPAEAAVPLKKHSGLRYGENPHQDAAVYLRGGDQSRSSVITGRQLQGKELSYNNYLDLAAAWGLVREFDKPACAIIKHSNPCGCAQADSILEAYKKALACDPASAFGGIIAFNREVDGTTAAEVARLFTECIIAPAYDKKALESFAAKKNLRLLAQPEAGIAGDPGLEYRSITGGLLAQDRDARLADTQKPATQRQATETEMDSLLFAWKVAKHVKSNAIVLVRGRQTVGVGAGQMSRIDSLRIASEKMKAVVAELPGGNFPLVMASDAFFPFPDVVNESAALGVTAIIQPGGSIRDEESIKAADGHAMAMVMTGMRHFRH